MQTHEAYIAAVAAAAIECATLTDEQRATLEAVKLVYGSGPNGVRGVTYYGRWKAGETVAPFVEIAAFGQESWVQVAGTTIHELAHVLSPGGHGKGWKAACVMLGLRRVQAAGTRYCLAMFAPCLRARIVAMPKPDDGEPVGSLGSLFGRGAGLGAKLKPCIAGIGTRGGKSRGPGSGSRLRLYHCECNPPVKVRASTDTLAAHCDHCLANFELQTTQPAF